jgi:hypothetical protein
VVQTEAATVDTTNQSADNTAIIGGISGGIAADFTSVDNNDLKCVGFVLGYADAENYYRLCRLVGGSSVLRIYRVRNGVETILSTTSIANPVPNVPFRASASISNGIVTFTVETITATAPYDTLTNGAPGLYFKTGTGVGKSKHTADNVVAGSHS